MMSTIEQPDSVRISIQYVQNTIVNVGRYSSILCVCVCVCVCILITTRTNQVGEYNTYM